MAPTWKDRPVDDDLVERVRAMKLLGLLRPPKRWRAREARGKGGRVVVVHGVDEGMSVLLVYFANGKLAGTFAEHCGYDRGPRRENRVERLLGESWAKRADARNSTTKERGHP